MTIKIYTSICLLLLSLNIFSQEKILFEFSQLDTTVAGNEVKLTVNIKIIEPISFARLQINLPEGFVPISNKKGTAQFIHSKNSIKWIWISLGDLNSQTIEVKFISNKNLKGQMDFEPVFSFADEDSSVHLKLPTVHLFLLPYVEPLVEVEQKKIIPKIEEEDKYTIQIVAKREDNPTAVKYYLKQNGLKEKAFSFKENDLFKFCIGRFKELEEAEVFRKKLSEKHNMKDVFIRVIPESK